MNDRPPLESYHLKRAIDDLLDRSFDLQADVRLGDATRRVENALAAAGEGAMAQRVDTRLVAQRLRMKGLRRIGWAGHGYDREPVYSRSQLDAGLHPGS